ncbi:cupin domain-containing protein [Streptomyces sp. NPDC057611]|uniref:cupin domain-containing protein n=1 Tax=Streptomyces sp. NPDC057611 TaxID=3346182 RepID=UPI0036C54EEE
MSEAPEVGGDVMTETMLQVGAQIRRIRKRRNLTLEQLSGQAGTSVSMLSMIERGVARPSIGTLVTISSALGIHMSDLFGAEDSSRSPVHRLADQVVVQTAEGVARRLVHNDASRGIEMVINEYQPGTSSSAEPTRHSGREFGILLEGSLNVEVDGTVYALKPGDAISYSSSSPHRFQNTGPAVARAVWVNLDD